METNRRTDTSAKGMPPLLTPLNARKPTAWCCIWKKNRPNRLASSCCSICAHCAALVDTPELLKDCPLVNVCSAPASGKSVLGNSTTDCALDLGILRLRLLQMQMSRGAVGVACFFSLGLSLGCIEHPDIAGRNCSTYIQLGYDCLLLRDQKHYDCHCACPPPPHAPAPPPVEDNIKWEPEHGDCAQCLSTPGDLMNTKQVPYMHSIRKNCTRVVMLVQACLDLCSTDRSCNHATF